MKRVLLASAGLVLASGLALAAGNMPSPPEDQGRGMGDMGRGMRGHMGHRMGGALLVRYDANGDGSITRAEIDAGIARDFRTADSDHNGKLSSAELKAYMEAQHAEMAAKRHRDGAEGAGASDGDKDGDKGGRGGHRGWGDHDPVKHLDWNLDGSLSAEEFAAPIRLLAMRLDRDASGTITATDLLARDGGPMGH